jgi:alkylation response protein AidB-like acyl-CoA dehydrogenase
MKIIECSAHKFKRAGVEACELFFDNVDVVKTNVLEK